MVSPPAICGSCRRGGLGQGLVVSFFAPSLATSVGSTGDQHFPVAGFTTQSCVCAFSVASRSWRLLSSHSWRVPQNLFFASRDPVWMMSWQTRSFGSGGGLCEELGGCATAGTTKLAEVSMSIACILTWRINRVPVGPGFCFSMWGFHYAKGPSCSLVRDLAAADQQPLAQVSSSSPNRRGWRTSASSQVDFRPW